MAVSVRYVRVQILKLTSRPSQVVVHSLTRIHLGHHQRKILDPYGVLGVLKMLVEAFSAYAQEVKVPVRGLAGEMMTQSYVCLEVLHHRVWVSSPLPLGCLLQYYWVLWSLKRRLLAAFYGFGQHDPGGNVP